MRTPLLSILGLWIGTSVADAGWTVSTLQCEYLSSPAMGIETARPRLTWINEPPAKGGSWSLGMEETHFQVQVSDATDAQHHKLLWDTGKVETSQRRAKRPLVYNQDGKAVPLRSAGVYEWRVRTWLQGIGNMTDSTGWSEPARFVVGLFDPSDDWQGASWIGHSDRSLNFFRRVISLPSSSAPDGPQPSVQRALLFVCGLGYHHVEIDGRPVTDARLEPGYTTFSKRAFYSTYDVTTFLLNQSSSSNKHVLTIELGNGYLHGVGGEPTGNRVVIATLKVLMEDGSRYELGTDEAWRVTQGPVVYDSVFNGEVYDGRIASSLLKASLRPDYDDSHWASASPASGPGGMLRSPHMPPIQPVQVLRAISLTEPKPGVFVFDFGQNTAGVCRLSLPVACLRGRLHGGQNLTLRHAEVLQHVGIVQSPAVPEPGMISTDNLKSARATDTYILSDDELQQRDDHDTAMIVYQPKFTYHGFRYAELSGLPAGVVPTLDWIVSLVQHTAVEAKGVQQFDNLVLSGVHRLTLWAQTSNLQSVPTDCPNRDERKGYGGDAQLSAEEAMYNFDMTATLLKFLRDMVEEMDEDGTIPDTTPWQAAFRPADPSWSTALPSITYYLYRDTGDASIVQEFYYPILRYMNWLVGQYELYPGNGISNFTAHFGDWVNVGWPKGRLNGHLTASASFIENCNQVSALATVMGDQEQADRFASLSSQLRHEWHLAFWNTSIGNYGGGEQTSMALALYLQAVPEELVSKVEAMLVEDILVTRAGHQSCGIIGTKYMFEVLSANMKRTDVGLVTAAQTSYPSFGYMLLSPLEPATTLWELWDSDKQGPGMNSRNHIMFGAIDAWFHRYLIGIRPSEDLKTAGFRDVCLTPYLDPCMRDVLGAASGQTRTVRGLVKLAWQWNVNGTYEVRATVPEGATGRLKLEGPQGAGTVTLLALNGLPPSKYREPATPALSLDLPAGVHMVLADFTPGLSCQDRGLPTIASAATA